MPPRYEHKSVGNEARQMIDPENVLVGPPLPAQGPSWARIRAMVNDAYQAGLERRFEQDGEAEQAAVVPANDSGWRA